MCGLLFLMDNGHLMKIPREFIADLLSRFNIVDVIGSRVKIKKRGKDYWGNCPFHNEKTASFSISEQKQIFCCFGCGAKGSIIDFLMTYENLSFYECIEELASIQSLQIPYYNENKNKKANREAFFASQNMRRDLYTLMGKITQFYQKVLTSPDAKLAQEYLAKRGLNDEIIQHYNIGYSPDDWDATSRAVVSSPQDKKLYEQAGMLVVSDYRRTYDRFRGRIMFPIRDRQGNVIAFGGRILKTNDTAKYINSPETSVFHKGNNLYGLYEVQKINRNPEKLLVVEGYMDVVSLAQYGIYYAVAALGTATTEEHIKLLFRATDNVIFCYDGDTAGKRAAWRALNTLMPILVDGKQVKFVFLPEADDPDSLVRKEGKDQFEQRLEQGLTLSQFLFDELLKQSDLTTAEGKSKLSALALPLIAQVKAPSYSLNLKQQLGNYLGLLDISQIDKIIRQNINNPIVNANINRNTNNPVAPAPASQLRLTTMRILIGLLIQYPELVKLVPDEQSLTQANLAGINIFIELIRTCKSYPNITTGQILTEYMESPAYKQLNTLASWEHKYPEDEIATIFSHTLKELYDNILAQRQDELIAKERVSGLSLDEKKELAAIILVLSKKD